MKILGFDLETGASFDNDTSENFITELGAALFDTDFNQPVRIYSVLVDEKDYDVIAPEAERYTGISQAMRTQYGICPREACEEFRSMALEADYYMAHNGIRFDVPILEDAFRRHGVDWVEKICIDSQHHVPYPDRFKKSLGALANAHLTMNPFPHRAIADVLTMFNIVFPPKRMEYDLDKIIQYAKEPKYIVKAEVEYPDRELAKSRGYYWAPNEGPKGSWLKEMTESQIKDSQHAVPFRMTILRKS